MQTDENDDISPRRLRTRRRGFGQGTSTKSESLHTSDNDYDDDEVERAVDPAEVRRSVEARASVPYVPPSPGSPRALINEALSSGNTVYARELRLTLMHKMLLRKVPLSKIAETLGVSISTAEKDRAELKKFLREEARKLNIDEIVGNQNAFYDEVSGMAMRVAGQTGGEAAVPVAMQLAALRTALAANADRNRFYTSAGVYDALRYRKADDGSNVSDVQQLMEGTRALLDQMASGGFENFTFNDPDDPEIMDL